VLQAAPRLASPRDDRFLHRVAFHAAQAQRRYNALLLAALLQQQQQPAAAAPDVEALLRDAAVPVASANVSLLAQQLALRRGRFTPAVRVVPPEHFAALLAQYSAQEIVDALAAVAEGRAASAATTQDAAVDVSRVATVAGGAVEWQPAAPQVPSPAPPRATAAPHRLRVSLCVSVCRRTRSPSGAATSRCTTSRHSPAPPRDTRGA
jgi:hypothetical protein